jgi:RNA polymerase sigma factor for flagellar operon FliA
MGRNVALRTAEKPTAKPLPLPDRETLVNDFLPGIRYHASSLKLRLPQNIEMEDLMSSGVEGLLDAAEKFDSSRGIKFKTYAEFRIRGAMLDYLREMDWFSRAARQNANRLEHAYARMEAMLARPPREEEVAEDLKISVAELRKQLALYSGLSVLSMDEPQDEYNGAAVNVQKALSDAAKEEVRKDEHLRDLKEMLANAIDVLPEREKQLIALYYQEELTMKEIGAIFGLGEPRVCQLHAQAILRLRGKLRSMREK